MSAAVAPRRISVEVREVAEVVVQLKAAGLPVTVEDGRVVVSGDTSDAFLRAGILTILHRPEAVEQALKLGTSFHAKLAAERRGFVEGARLACVRKTAASDAATPPPGTCFRGHPRSERHTRRDGIAVCNACARVRRLARKAASFSRDA